MMPNEMLLVDKPVGFSSFQIVRILKRYYRKVGHAGTLDPFASGLLLILIGTATKRFQEIQKYEKEYSGELILGMVTDTYDISGALDEKLNEPRDFSLRGLNEIAEEFTGKIEQTPPRFSAIKQGGRKMYQLSRKGTYVNPKSREVFIKTFRITEFENPKLKFNAVVGKGVYIRSLAHDFGNRLGCGATLMTLRRIRIGDYDVSQTKKIGEILDGECYVDEDIRK